MTKSANELLLDYILVFESQLPRYEASLMAKMRKRLKKLEKSLIEAIHEFDPSAPATLTYRQKRMIAMLEQVRTDIASTYRGMRGDVEKDLLRLANLSSSATTNAINTAIGVPTLTTSVSPTLLEKVINRQVIQGAKSAEWWNRQAGNVKFNFKTRVSDGIYKGLSVSDIARSITGTKSLNYADGIMATSRRNAESLVRTSVINTTNGSRLATLQANKDILDGIQWVSTLDGSTTPICQALSGLEWDFEYKPIGHNQAWPGPTAHWNCRSTQVPVIKKFSGLTKRQQKEIPEAKRASMDGLVPASMNYEDWLRAKDKTNPDFVRKTLGSTKYKYWKKEGLSLRDMVDQRNNPLPIDRLEKQVELH